MREDEMTNEELKTGACSQCRFLEADLSNDPCANCFNRAFHPAWEPREEEAASRPGYEPEKPKKEKAVKKKKDCTTCAFRFDSEEAEPCSSCDGYEFDKWKDGGWLECTIEEFVAGTGGEEDPYVKTITGEPEKPRYQRQIESMIDAQVKKGRGKYGVTLEENGTLTSAQRIEHLEEELIDGLMYCEHIKALGEQNGLLADDYQRAALRTAQADVLTPDELLLNGVMGLCGEAGECIDLVKKARFQGHELEREKLMKELGDVAWYLAVASWGLGYPLSSVLTANVEKLKARYPDGFDKARSMKREE